jgi:hypothetical protein
MDEKQNKTGACAQGNTIQPYKEWNLSFETTRVEPEIIVLSEISQAQNNDYHAISLVKDLLSQALRVEVWLRRLGRVVGRKRWEKADQGVLSYS